MNENKSENKMENNDKNPNIFTKLKDKCVKFYNEKKAEKWFKIALVGVPIVFLSIIILSVTTCSSCVNGGLKGDDAKAFKMNKAIFKTLDEPENADVLSGTIDEFGDGYFWIGIDNTYAIYFYDSSSKKVYDTAGVIMRFGSYSYEYTNMARLASYDDPYLNYEAINKALDKAFD